MLLLCEASSSSRETEAGAEAEASAMHHLSPLMRPRHLIQARVRFREELVAGGVAAREVVAAGVSIEAKA